MQVSVETTSGLERRLTVGVPAERVENEVNSRLQRAAKNIKLDGFRPGKVPMKVIKQRFGAGVRQEVIGEVMSQSFYEAVNQENLRPAGQPNIEPRKMDEGADIEFVATFEIFPEIALADMEGVEISRVKADVTDEDIDKMIEVFRNQQGSWNDADRPAQSGDQVIIDFVGTKDGEAFEGGSAQDSELLLGSARMIPGFEEGIEGMQVGEEKVLPLTFPENYQAEELQGAAVEFTITLKAVKERTPAPLDEELFKTYGVEEGGVEKFREEIAQNMQRELKNAVRSSVKQQVLDAVVEKHAEQEVPQALIDSEIGAMRQQMFQQFGGAADDMDLETILPADMFSEQAERRVKLGLVLGEIVAKNEIKADPDKVRETIEEIASTYQEPEQVVNWYYSNQEQLSGIENMVVEEAVIELILESAVVSDNECSYQEAMEQTKGSEAE
ncbi:MAG: trigger factor [Pseudomonadota bacterium]